LNAKRERVVVLVEDDPSVLRALRRLVTKAGYKVMIFDRPSAVLAAEVPAVDACLVVDFHLPEMNGAELCDALAASGCLLPIIFVSAHLDEQTRSTIVRRPSAIVLSKPFRREELFEALASSFASGDGS
jgi:FixJ family two-component response regulator